MAVQFPKNQLFRPCLNNYFSRLIMFGTPNWLLIYFAKSFRSFRTSGHWRGRVYTSECLGDTYTNTTCFVNKIEFKFGEFSVPPKKNLDSFS